MQESDSYLIKGLKNRDEQAFKYLFEHHYAAMCAMAEMLVVDAYTAETIVSDLFYHIWEAAPRLEIRGGIRPYLAAAVKNRCRNYLAQNFVRREELHQPFLFGTEGLDVAGIESTSGPLLQQELDNEIRAAIEALPDKTRTVFAKSRLEGKDYAQIARECGISVHTVKYHMGQALKEISRRLEPYLAILLIFLSL